MVHITTPKLGTRTENTEEIKRIIKINKQQNVMVKKLGQYFIFMGLNKIIICIKFV